jgi:hypothetical protein
VASGLILNPDLKLTTTLFNIHPTDTAVVSTIFVTWDGTAKFSQAILGPSEIWSGWENPPSALVTGFYGNTQINPASSKPMVLQFANGNLQVSASTVVIVGFDNGCAVTSTFN